MCWFVSSFPNFHGVDNNAQGKSNPKILSKFFRLLAIQQQVYLYMIDEKSCNTRILNAMIGTQITMSGFPVFGNPEGED
jgi:hypothetical protein